jgi:predicted ester cyclase
MRRKNFILIMVGFVFSLCFTFSCQDKKAMAELEAMKAQAEVEEQNKALVQRILEEGDKSGAAILDEVCTSDYKMYFPSNAEPINLEEHKELWQAFIVAFPDLTHRIDEFIAEGDMVSTRETLSGTHKGEFQGIPPTGKKFEFSAICIWRFSDGKLAEYWSDGDILGLMMQLGMELKPKEGEK